MIVILHNVSYHCRKLSAPDESSTPLVRSSERLAAKRRGLQAESLETLYFTPINTRQMNRYVLHLTVERLTVDVSVFLGFTHPSLPYITLSTGNCCPHSRLYIYMEICMKINKNSVLEMLVFLFSPRTITENNIDLDSARKNPTSSVKRRRTTQVINITMTKVEETHLHTYCMCLHVHINTHC